MSQQQNTTSSYAQAKAKHPRMGKRWEAEEDERLKKAYEALRLAGLEDFDQFLEKLVAEFGRASGGLRARLAQYFDDVPGWDYAQDKYRKEQARSELEAAFSPERDAKLKAAYEAYMQKKDETYISFSKRMSQTLGGVAPRLIKLRLEQLTGSVVLYKKVDVALGTMSGSSVRPWEVPLTHIDFSDNPEALEVLRIMDETSDNLFLTGEAGTGKSTLLQYFRQRTKKNVVVLAPTGVAALNVGGQTIHSFCGFGPDITLSKVKRSGSWSPKKKLLAQINTIVIDEISMVRADLLDCVDKFLQLNSPRGHLPFGGYQMVFIGDLFQLPPVEKDFVAGDGLLKQYPSPYFFDSIVFRTTNFLHVSLQHMYRQQDRVFIELLNAVRNNAVTSAHLELLNSRAHEENGNKFSFEQYAMYLTPTNARARQVNNFFLEKIHAPLLKYTGRAAGTFENRELPTDLDLYLKVGAQVMMLSNDQRKRWVNGTMGKVVGVRSVGEKSSVEVLSRPNSLESLGDVTYEYIDEELVETSPTTDALIVELETGEVVYVEPYTWEMFKFVASGEDSGIESQTTGTFTQYPLKLAWAVTIHKAQGKTFNKVYVDLGTGTFAHGQLYVALSRCRSLDGLYLKSPVTEKDIIVDPRVAEFMTKQLYRRGSES